MRHLLIAAALAVGLSTGCTADGLFEPPPGLAHAAASATCGPADGPAVVIYLSASELTSADPPRPYVLISVWRPLGHLEGTWSLAASSTDGFAARHGASPEDVEGATHGSITVLDVRGDSSIVASVDITLESGARIRGGFTAAWIPRTTLCG